MRYLFCCNTLQGFCNFRLDVVKHLVGQGNEAVIVYPQIMGDERMLENMPSGCRAIACKMSPNGTSLFQDAVYLFGLLRIFREENPDLVFNYTVKPNIYGGIAASICGIPSVAMAPGLGYTFTKRGFVGALLRRFYIMGLKLSKFVFVLNSSDKDSLIMAGVDYKKIDLLQGGEGVDLERFSFTKGDFNNPRFLMISRLLYDKGYSEFVEVSKRIRQLYPNVRFEIAGALSENSPSGVPRNVVDEDDRSGSVKILGHVKDIVLELSDSNTVVVLPSYYREGMNRSLMEACSCGRPVITTCLPGLQEMVVDGVNGFLVEPRNVVSLFNKIVSFLELPVESRVDMGRKSRELAERRFNIEMVRKEYDKIIESIFNNVQEVF